MNVFLDTNAVVKLYHTLKRVHYVIFKISHMVNKDSLF